MGAYAARRTADLLVINMWKTGRYEIHGVEVKVSRADWPANSGILQFIPNDDDP